MAPPDAHELTLDEERKKQTPPEQLALPMIDGRGIDLMEISVTGTVKLDRGDPNDVALIRRLTAGKTVPLKIEAFVSGTGANVSRDDSGYADKTTLKKTLTVVSLDRPAGDLLGDENDD
jgi:hypothetical protein